MFTGYFNWNLVAIFTTNLILKLVCAAPTPPSAVMFLPTVPVGGTMGLQTDFLFSSSFFSFSTPPTFGYKDNLCGQCGGGYCTVLSCRLWVLRWVCNLVFYISLSDINFNLKPLHHGIFGTFLICRTVLQLSQIPWSLGWSWFPPRQGAGLRKV